MCIVQVKDPKYAETKVGKLIWAIKYPYGNVYACDDKREKLEEAGIDYKLLTKCDKSKSQ